MLSNSEDQGLLIAFEGPDGSGKTTQRKLFKSWLRLIREDVVVTKWNSSKVFKPIIKQRKAARLLDPEEFAILHAGDFWSRYETVIQPALATARTVLSDRYVFTGIARDIARGLDPSWAASLYAGARRPDLVFYFKARVETCADRLMSAGGIKFYESGQDVTGLEDPYESYLRFTHRVVAEYERLHNEFGFVVVDAELPIYDQLRFIRETYLAYTEGTFSARAVEPQLHPFLTEVDV